MDNLLPTPERVNKDIVESTMACVGYSRTEWRTVFTLTAINIMLAVAVAVKFVPEVGVVVAGCIMALGALLAIALWQIRQDQVEHDLAIRNALERRLGLPEHARHREGYFPYDL